MASFKISSLGLAVFLVFFFIASDLAAAQNCGCAPGLCCSKYGYCGSSDAYCGDGCQQGPCTGRGGAPSGGGGSVGTIVSPAFFDGIANQAGGGCAGKGFYTRAAFLTAAGSFSRFGSEGGADAVKREIAAYFAHATHETGHFCYIDEINGAAHPYCEPKPQWPCTPGKSYHGRGPLQLSWNYNYGPAGRSIGFDGLNKPETVSSDRVVSFKTALWFWMNNCHNAIVSGQGFGATIRAINGMECNGKNSNAVNARVRYYTSYCRQLGVSPGNNLSC